MSEPPAQDELRLTVAGDPEVVVELVRADVPDSAGPGLDVRALAEDAGVRAQGRRRFEVTVDGWVLQVTVESAARARLLERAGQAARQSGPQHAAVLRAQIPGRIVRLWVAAGDSVEAGQRLLAIEAMKMENEIRAPRAGVVESVRVVVGASVELGNELLTVR